MERNTTFTEGKILQPLILFAMPVLFALFLQAMYGAVDLLVVGKFASSADVSAVSTGSQIMMTLTNLISCFAMGTTVLLGQLIGCGKKEEGGKAVGTAMVMFAGIALVMTVLLVCFAPQISSIMHAPKEAFDKTAAYVRICGCGMIVIVAYNLIGCIFRGIGDSKMPLFTVAIACVCNIAGDLVLCAGFHMGTTGAACATVFAQVVSVVVSFGFIRKKQLPFVFKKENVRIHKDLLKKMAGLGAPIALQDLLVSISFLIILAIVNSMGVTASAGVEVAEKVCAFIMLISSAFMQSMSAFVAQNYGAGRMDRAKKALYNGIGQTKFVMLQGIAGAFGVRVPVSYLMSIRPDTSLFKIGLATPMSSVVQLLLCLGFMVILNRRARKGEIR
ncbi:MAG: MATE family efflux transporter [Clostridium sp.]